MIEVALFIVVFLVVVKLLRLLIGLAFAGGVLLVVGSLAVPVVGAAVGALGALGFMALLHLAYRSWCWWHRIRWVRRRWRERAAA